MELQDKIGRQHLVDKMEYLIKNLPQDEHFCLALDGEWGSGKSFVMGMLQNEFESHADEYLVINYDAWKNNFYPDPLIAILYCVLDSIPKLHLAKKDLRLVLRAAKQVARDRIANGVDFFIDELYKTGGWPSVCAFAMEIIKLVIKQAKSSILGNKLFDDYKSYQSLLNESLAVLNALTAQKTADGKQRRLIILVDEIDRCLPNEQLIVLERLHHLFAVKNCAVIIALNKKAIYSTFDNQYGGNGIEYLRKFFSYNFVVETEYTTLLSNLIKDFIEDINNSKKQNYVYTEQEIEPLISALLNEFCRISLTYKFSYSNRDVKNYFDKFHRIWEKDKPLNIAYIGFLLFMVLYKQYEEAYFPAYKEGMWNNNPPETFKFGDNVLTTSGYPFSYEQINASYPLYNNSFCNKFTSFMNSVRFRNDKDVSDWFQILNSTNFYRLYTFNEKDGVIVENCFKEIENYGTMTKGNRNEKQRN